MSRKSVHSYSLHVGHRLSVSGHLKTHVAPVNCARAMDRIKHLIASPGSTDAQAWRQMREALHIDEDYLKFITEASKGPRHGRPGHTPGIETTEATRRAWSVMNRYFEFVKRGRTPLATHQFNILA